MANIPAGIPHASRHPEHAHLIKYLRNTGFELEERETSAAHVLIRIDHLSSGSVRRTACVEVGHRQAGAVSACVHGFGPHRIVYYATDRKGWEDRVVTRLNKYRGTMPAPVSPALTIVDIRDAVACAYVKLGRPVTLPELAQIVSWPVGCVRDMIASHSWSVSELTVITEGGVLDVAKTQLIPSIVCLRALLLEFSKHVSTLRKKVSEVRDETVHLLGDDLDDEDADHIDSGSLIDQLRCWYTVTPGDGLTPAATAVLNSCEVP